MARSKLLLLIASLIFFSMCCRVLAASNAIIGLNISQIQKLTGQSGQLDREENIYKITIPRDDLKILMSGMQISPELGLSSWIAFKKTDNQTSVNGDLILLQDQINPVMSVALTYGLEVTGLHSPYLWDSPRVMFMHIKGEGDELQLANAVGQVLKKIKATSNGGGDFPVGNFDFLRTTLDAHKIDSIFGQKGQFKDDVYKIEFGDGVKAADTAENKAMAINSWAAFAGSDSEAVVNGTMVLHKSELQKALVKLRNAKIFVLAIYQNMISTGQDLVLVNYWGVGSTETLARTIRTVFLIAQTSSPDNIMVGEIVPSISPVNMRIEKGFNIAPIQLGLTQKEYCNYARAIEYDSPVGPSPSTDYAKQLGTTLKTALNLTQKIVSEKMVKLVSFLPTTSFRMESTEKPTLVLPSAENLLLKLSVVSNNVPGNVIKSLAITTIGSSLQSTDQATAYVPPLKELSNTENREIFAPSANKILAKLSVVEKSNINLLTAEPINTTKPIVKSKTPSTTASMTRRKVDVSAIANSVKNSTADLAAQLQDILFIHTTVNGVKSLAKTVPAALIDTGAHSQAYLSGLAAGYLMNTKSNFATISSFYADANTNAHLYINKLLDRSHALLKSLKSAASDSFNNVNLKLNGTAQDVAIASGKMDYINYNTVLYSSKLMSELKNRYIRIYQSGVSAASDTVARINLRLKDINILSAKLENALNQADYNTVGYMYGQFHTLTRGYENVFESLMASTSSSTRTSKSASLDVPAYLRGDTAQFSLPVILAINNNQPPPEEHLKEAVLKPTAPVLPMAKMKISKQQSSVLLPIASTMNIAKQQSNVPLPAAPTMNIAKQQSSVPLPVVSTMNIAKQQSSVPLPVTSIKVNEKSMSTVKGRLASAKLETKIPGSLETFRKLLLPRFSSMAVPHSLKVQAEKRSLPYRLSTSGGYKGMVHIESKPSTHSTKTEYKVPNMHSSFAKMLIPTFITSHTLAEKPQAKVDSPALQASPEHKPLPVLPAVLPIVKHTHSYQITKFAAASQHAHLAQSLIHVLPFAKQPVSTAVAAKKVSGNALTLQHKVIRVATLGKLHAVMPPTKHPVHSTKRVDPINKHLAKVVSQSLPHFHVGAWQKVVKARHSSSFAKITQHTISIQRANVHKTVFAPRVHAEVIKQNWNREQLAPAHKPAIHTSPAQHQNLVHKEVDDGLAVVGYYPYDEEPSSEGFSS